MPLSKSLAIFRNKIVRVLSTERNREWDGNSLNAGKGATALTEDKIDFAGNCQLWKVVKICDLLLRNFLSICANCIHLSSGLVLK